MAVATTVVHAEKVLCPTVARPVVAMVIEVVAVAATVIEAVAAAATVIEAAVPAAAMVIEAAVVVASANVAPWDLAAPIPIVALVALGALADHAARVVSASAHQSAAGKNYRFSRSQRECYA